MIIIGVDPHPHSHTAAALDHNGQMLSTITVDNDEAGLAHLSAWARQFSQRCWAVEGAGNHFIASWVAQQLGEGEQVVNISPNLTSQYRSRRGKKKDDVIDAQNAARVLLANPKLPKYQACDRQIELKKLTRTRTRLAQQLSANRLALRALDAHTLPGFPSVTPAHESLTRLIACLETELVALDRILQRQVKSWLPELLSLQGIGSRVAAVILAEVGDTGRFADEHAFASYSGSAPVPKSSGSNRRAQVNPGGNRRLNWALHIIALTRLRLDSRSQALVARKRHEGKTQREAIRVLKTYIARELYRFLNATTHPKPACS